MPPPLTLISPIILNPDAQFGRAMRMLSTDKQRAFVIAMLENPSLNLAAACRRAGYAGSEDTMKSYGHRLAHDPKILAAIQEEAKNRMASGAIYAVSRLLEIISDPSVKASDQLKGIEMLLNRVGMHARTEITQNINHTVTTDKDMITKIENLASQLGLDSKVLLGRATIDAEFVEVEPEPGDDIEDIL